MKLNSLNIVRLHGVHVDLCSFRYDDEAIRKYIEWMNDEQILKYINGNTNVVDWVNETEYARQGRNKIGLTSFNIVDKDDNLIGNCDIKQQGISRTYELGILIGEERSRGKGYGTEVISMLLKFCFEELNAHHVFLKLNASNERAFKCYKKCGFKEVGRLREQIYSEGKFFDMIYMDILENEYFNK